MTQCVVKAMRTFAASAVHCHLLRVQQEITAGSSTARCPLLPSAVRGRAVEYSCCRALLLEAALAEDGNGPDNDEAEAAANASSFSFAPENDAITLTK